MPNTLPSSQPVALHINCLAGAAGDMFIGAFAGLGVQFAPLEAMFTQASLPLTIQITPENREAGIGLQVHIVAKTAQPLRHLPEILTVLNALPCSNFVRQQSVLAFTVLAQAEAHVHGCSINDIHFHEVGAVDTLVDVVGAFWSIEQLGITSITSTPLPWFSGSVTCEHGVIPLPAPATLELMKGLPVAATNFTEEVVTPTGALIMRQLTHYFAAQLTTHIAGTACNQSIDHIFRSPSGLLLQSATGYGNRYAPQGLRLSLFDTTPVESAHNVVVLETHIDHLTGEELGLALEGIMEDGALDVLWTPGITKKNRPAGCLCVLCAPQQKQAIIASIFTHTHTLGIRTTTTTRTVLPRQYIQQADNTQIKEYTLTGVTYQREESDSIRTKAKQQNVGAPAIRITKKKSQ